jgi:predicted nuclease of predicted toxin-antitoxin system
MSIKYLLDENLPPLYRAQLLRLQPDLTVWMVGDPGVPPKSTLDPEILTWCELNNCILVTNNRSSMPIHLKAHLAQGFHVPGIFVLRPRAIIKQVLDDLILIALAVEETEYQDRIVHIPLI